MAADHFLELTPTSLQKFVDKKVTLTLCDKRKIIGLVYTIDPVTYCVVILPLKEDIPSQDSLVKSGESVVFVTGHAVASIHVHEDDLLLEKPNFNDIFQVADCKRYSEDELSHKKAKLEEWLKKNRIPVEETEKGVLCVMGTLWIEPPYTADCCRCTNEIVLNRVQTLITNLPDVG